MNDMPVLCENCFTFLAEVTKLQDEIVRLRNESETRLNEAVKFRLQTVDQEAAIMNLQALVKEQNKTIDHLESVLSQKDKLAYQKDQFGNWIEE